MGNLPGECLTSRPSWWSRSSTRVRVRFSGEFGKNKTVGIENTMSTSMKTLDTLDSYSLVTWSGSQEDPSMV